MQTEEFRFWQKSRMENNPAWIGVHDFLREGLNALLERLDQVNEDRRTIIQQNLARLSKLDKVRDYTYTVDQVSGDNYSVEEVVDIFNRVNSRGTPLTRRRTWRSLTCAASGRRPEPSCAASALQDGGARLRRRSELPRAVSRGGGDRLGGARGLVPQDARGSVAGRLGEDAAGVRAPGERPAPRGVHQRSRRPAHQLRAGAGRHLPGASRADSSRPTPVKRRFIRWIYLAGLWARYSGASETKLQQDVALVAGRDLDPDARAGGGHPAGTRPRHPGGRKIWTARASARQSPA